MDCGHGVIVEVVGEIASDVKVALTSNAVAAQVPPPSSDFMMPLSCTAANNI
jgi:hypothetical protein